MRNAIEIQRRKRSQKMRVVMENQRKAWHLRCCKKKKKGRILVRELAKCYQDKRNRINTQEEK